MANKCTLTVICDSEHVLPQTQSVQFNIQYQKSKRPCQIVEKTQAQIHLLSSVQVILLLH